MLLGDHPSLHLVLLGALNGLAAYLLLRACRTRLSSRSSLLVTLVWVALANRGSSRLWISTGPTVVALVLLLGAAVFALRRPPRLAPAVVLVVLSALFYEGGILIGLALVVIAAWGGRAERRLVRLAVAVGAVGVTGASVYLNSPKLQGTAAGPADPSRWISALLGSALLPDVLAGASVLIIVAVLLVAASAVVPELRRPETVPLLAAGAAVTVLGMLPFLAVGFPVSTDGFLDRATTFATVGVALLIGAVLDELWRLPAPVATALAGVAVVILASANVTDLSDVHAAERDGNAVLAAVVGLDVPPNTPIVLAPTPNHGGYAPFGYGTIEPAVQLRTGRTLDISDSLTEDELQHKPGVKYRLEGDQLVRLPDGS
jgi:hypothetical protein